MYRLLGVGWGRGATRRDPRLLFISVFFWHTSVLWDVIMFYGKKNSLSQVNLANCMNQSKQRIEGFLREFDRRP